MPLQVTLIQNIQPKSLHSTILHQENAAGAGF